MSYDSVSFVLMGAVGRLIGAAMGYLPGAIYQIS